MPHIPQVRPAVAQVIAEAARFADEELAPNGGVWERERRQPEDVLRRAIRAFTDVGIPEELGGRGLGLSTVMQYYEALAARDLGFTCALAVHNAVTIAATVIPDRNLMDLCLPRLMSGQAIGAFSLTEPTAGSDAGAIGCQAVPTSEGYLLNGRKAWVTSGCNADLFLTFLQSDPSQRAKGIIGLVVDRDTSGLTTSPPLALIGSHAMGTTDLEFTDAVVPADRLAFGPGKGFSAALSGIDVARTGVAAMCNGALAGALDAATHYATSRRAFGQRVFDNQGIQFPLADVATALEASRALTQRAANLMDAGEPATVAAAHAKKFATKAAFDGISQCIQVFGANGIKEDTGLGRQLASARICAFMDGTSEILNLVIARAMDANT